MLLAQVCFTEAEDNLYLGFFEFEGDAEFFEDEIIGEFDNFILIGFFGAWASFEQNKSIEKQAQLFIAAKLKAIILMTLQQVI